MSFYGRNGELISLEEWANRIEDREYAIVQRTDIPQTSKYPPSWLSTVWLGINYSLGLGPPIIFETMRFTVDPRYEIGFPEPEEPHEYIEQARYYTEEQASLGHRNILRLIQELERS